MSSCPQGCHQMGSKHAKFFDYLGQSLKLFKNMEWLMNLYETKKKYLRVVRIWCFQQMMLRHKRSMPKQGDSMQNFFQLLYGLPKHIKWCGKNQNRDSNPGANFSVVARTCWGLQLSQSLFVPFWDWTKLRFDKIQSDHNFKT